MNKSTFLKITIIIYLLICLPFWYFHIFSFGLDNSAGQLNSYQTALVLGAGIRCASYNNQVSCYPSSILKSRLDKAVELYSNKQIKKILISGDNRRVDYDEPKAMYKYLISQNIPQEDIISDFGGASTIQSCWRAKNVFKIKEVIVITQAFHIPRSVYLCKSVGLDTEFATAESGHLASTAYGVFREIPASWKAWIESINYQPEIGTDSEEESLSDFS